VVNSLSRLVAIAAAYFLAHPITRDEAGVAFDQYHSGITIVRRVLPELADSYSKLVELRDKAKGEDLDQLKECVDDLDDAGSKLAEYNDEPVTETEFRAHFSAYNEIRVEAIEACENAEESYKSAIHKLEAMPKPERFSAVLKPLKEQHEDIQDAIEQFGGDLPQSSYTNLRS